ncbi:MAG: 50S ribosomal protein L29 [Gemmatimonadota bacterium]|nr:50S ribosomal protein L29 [Gemmatimonadota bacterium]
MLSSKDIREFKEAEINAKIAEMEEERFRLKFRAGTETLEDPLRLRVIRKDIARLNTVLREKIIGIAEAGTSASLPKAGGAKTRRIRRKKSGATRSSKRA